MIEEAVEDYQRAKLKALERLGLQSGDRRALPNDEEVDAARDDYRRLFGGSVENRGRCLEELRTLALEIMDHLEPFAPLLVGSVADGTAGRHSPVIIHAFPDAPEDVLTALINLRIPYREGHHLLPRSGNQRPAPIPAVTLNHPCSTVDILLFPPALRGRSMPRKKNAAAQASRSDLLRLLGQATPNSDFDADAGPPATAPAGSPHGI